MGYYLRGAYGEQPIGSTYVQFPINRPALIPFGPARGGGGGEGRGGRGKGWLFQPPWAIFPLPEPIYQLAKVTLQPHGPSFQPP